MTMLSVPWCLYQKVSGFGRLVLLRVMYHIREVYHIENKYLLEFLNFIRKKRYMEDY